MRLGSAASSGAAGAAAAALAAAALATGANSCFGILDNTADELSDIFGVNEFPEPAAELVRTAAPLLYEPIKTVTPSCTEGLFPEFNDVNDFNDCLLLPRRLVWRGGDRTRPPLFLSQTMSMATIWQQSTGSSIWGGGLALARYLDGLGSDFWAGKRVLELGTGTGLGAISAATNGASLVVATDRDADVLKLAAENARANGVGVGPSGPLRTSKLEWGDAAALSALLGGDEASTWDVVIGADLTYNKDGWEPLTATLRAARAPAILSASERRPNELTQLRAFLTSAGLRYTTTSSPLDPAGYGGRKVQIFLIDAYDGPLDLGEDSLGKASRAAEPTTTV